MYLCDLSPEVPSSAGSGAATHRVVLRPWAETASSVPERQAEREGENMKKQVYFEKGKKHTRVSDLDGGNKNNKPDS